MSFDLLTDEEAAEVLGCKADKVRSLRRGGKLPYLRSRPVLMRRSDLEKYLAEERQRTAHRFHGPPTKEKIAEAERKATSQFLRRLISQGKLRSPE